MTTESMTPMMLWTESLLIAAAFLSVVAAVSVAPAAGWPGLCGAHVRRFVRRGDVPAAVRCAVVRVPGRYRAASRRGTRCGGAVRR